MSNKKYSIPGSQKARRFVKLRPKKNKASSVNEGAVPRITNDTVSKHREEVISGAKKYVYPLRQSRHRIVLISMIILGTITIGFLTFMIVNLYVLQTTSQFAYQVTKFLPFPVGRIGSSFVAYENYLFEMRHQIHYIESQQNVDFKGEGAQQLEVLKQDTKEMVLNDEYALGIARDKGIVVSEQEVTDQIELLKRQNKLGNDDKVFEDVLKSYYNWDLSDFRRKVKQQLINAKVTRALDPSVKQKADKAMAELKAGASFKDVAVKYSDDPATKEKGGAVGYLVSIEDRNVPPQTLDAISNLKPGQISEIIDLGNEAGLEIIRLDAVEGGKYKISRISFSYKTLDEYLKDIKKDKKSAWFIKTPETTTDEPTTQP